VETQAERDAAERDACLAPEGKTWEMLLRQEAALDRSIDRKVKIILTMRKEHDRLSKGGSRTAPSEPDDRAAQELTKLVGLDARSGRPAEENAGETSKSPEQSENVIENKGPAAERCAHEQALQCGFCAASDPRGEGHWGSGVCRFGGCGIGGG